MPAIQPDFLQRQIDDLLAQADVPSAFVRSCMNLLDYYADRTKRPRRSTSQVEIAQIMRVPRPVLRTICIRVGQSTAGSADDWLAIGNALWDKGVRESRRIAACVLEKSPQDEIPFRLEAWATSCEDDQALRYLTSIGMRAWRREDLSRFYRLVEGWLGDNRLVLRHTAILALAARAEDENFSELPEMLDVLRGVSSGLRGSSTRSLTNLIRQLTAQSPAEVAKFLIDELKAGVNAADRLAQQSMGAMPEHLQREIRLALR